jgi:putative DNA primase/helicase
LSRGSEGLHIAEGIETALAAMARGYRPMWSTGSTAIMAKLPVLAGIEALTIVVDNDPNGAGQAAAREVAGRWLEAGREVWTVTPEEPGDLADGGPASRFEVWAV